MSRLLTALCAAVLALALVGCGGGGPENTLLVGTWFPTGGDPKGETLPVDINLVRVTFTDDGTWKVSGGCAEFSGTYDLGLRSRGRPSGLRAVGLPLLEQ